MTKYTIMVFDPVDRKVKKFLALDVDVSTAGVWTFGHWSEDDPRSAAKYFFPMDKVKWIKEGTK